MRAVTSTSRTPPPLIDATKTSAPVAISTGTDSPVIAARSTVDRPCRMLPSVAKPVAGTDDHDVADLEVLGRDVGLAATATHRDPLGDKREQRAKATPRSCQRVALERLGDREQERQ